MINKKSLRNCHKPEATKETWQLSATWYPGWDLEAEAGR